LRLSATSALGGALFILIGAWLAAWIAFGVGLASAIAAYLLGRPR
jgi:hypothetical protein